MPRSRGITLMVASLAAVTHSTVALRVHLSLLTDYVVYLAPQRGAG